MKVSASAANSAKSSPLERRGGSDRRRQRAFPSLFNRPRRRKSAGRRAGDRGYVDIYDRKSWILALTIMAMSFLDAVLTVLQIERGTVREANPLMSVVLAWGGVFMFFSLKACMTALPLAIIFVHKEWPLARHMVRLCFLCYVLILFYHLYLIWQYTGVTVATLIPH